MIEKCRHKEYKDKSSDDDYDVGSISQAGFDETPQSPHVTPRTVNRKPPVPLLSRNQRRSTKILLSNSAVTPKRSKRPAFEKATKAIKEMYENTLPRVKRFYGNMKAESEESEMSSDWREGEFSWIKFTKNSKYLPGFVYPAIDGIKYAQSITLKGRLSRYKFVIYSADIQIDDRLKSERYKKKAVAVFCRRNDCFLE